MTPSGPVTTCSLCGYEVVTYSDAVEALESGSKCLLCGGALDGAKLKHAVDHWDDLDILDEGRARALDEQEWHEDQEWVDSGHDFGDEGEDEEDEIPPPTFGA
jgi:hypothetical protein